MQIKEMEDVVRQSQAYSSTLQSYNTSLQNDLKEEKSKRDEAARERDLLQGKAAELGGLVKSLEQQLSYERVGGPPQAAGGVAACRLFMQHQVTYNHAAAPCACPQPCT